MELKAFMSGLRMKILWGYKGKESVALKAFMSIVIYTYEIHKCFFSWSVFEDYYLIGV